jgi:hypothetical protein
MRHSPDKNTSMIRKWLKKSKNNITKLAAFLDKEGHASHGIAHTLSAHDFKTFRKKIITEFNIK